MVIGIIFVILLAAYAALGFIGSLSVLVRATIVWRTSGFVRFCTGAVVLGYGMAAVYGALVLGAHQVSEPGWPETLLGLGCVIAAPTLWWIATVLCWLNYANIVLTRYFHQIPDLPASTPPED